MGDFTIKSTFYNYRNHINIVKDIKLFITKGTMKVEYQYKGVPIIKQFMIPFNEVYHLINGEFSSDIMKSDKNWYEDNIYIFLSFTLRSNIEKIGLPFKFSKGSKESEYDREYRELYSVTYNLGRENVLKMYKCFVDIVRDNDIKIGKVAYLKVHRLSNSLDRVNIVDFKKFENLIDKFNESQD